MKYHNRIISDLSAMTVSLDLLEIKHSYNCRFNPILLSGDSFCEYLTHKSCLLSFSNLMTRARFQIQHYGKA